MASLIGDPPNILIGSAAGLDFLAFLFNTGPISLVILLAFLGLSWFLFKKDLQSDSGDRLDVGVLDTSDLISNRPLLFKSLVVLGAVVMGFVVHGIVHLEPATIAMGGATLLLLWTRSDPHHVLQDVEWTTLLFFVGLFILVEGVVAVGLIEIAAQAALRVTGGSLPLTAILILWLSAIVSGIVDNIPYTATMIPIVHSLGHTMPIEPLWWSLSLGACLGGSATLVGASANVVVAGLSERSGHRISFRLFLRYGVITTFMSLVLATLYVWLRYL
jgi:Na+/H+ antiporter NhaD/arsenite permease-like protein